MSTGEVTASDKGGRRALIDATVAAIEEHGLDGVSLRSITRRADVSHAAPAHHFGDKAGLFTAVALEGFEVLQRMQTEALERAAGEPPAVRLQALAIAYVNFAITHKAHFEVMFRPELLRADDPDLQTAGLTAYAFLRNAVEAAHDQGFAAAWDVDELTLAAWALSHGIVELATNGVLGHIGFPVSPVDLATSLTRMIGEVIDSVGRP